MTGVFKPFPKWSVDGFDVLNKDRSNINTTWTLLILTDTKMIPLNILGDQNTGFPTRLPKLGKVKSISKEYLQPSSATSRCIFRKLNPTPPPPLALTHWYKFAKYPAISF